MTNDTSVGLYDISVNDIYHSAFGALTEAYEKFVLPLNLKELLKNNSKLRVLDICCGVCYNTKAFLNEYLKYKNSYNNITIDCVDTNKLLIELAPFISSKISFFYKSFKKDLLYKNVLNYDEANKIVSLKSKKRIKYNINKKINEILLKNLVEIYGTEFLSQEAKNILSENDFLPFFDQQSMKLHQKYLNRDIQLHQKRNLSTYLHNIYYENISKRFNKLFISDVSESIKINFYPLDIRQYLRNAQNSYDVVFLDGFTPAKCPCIWSLDFFTNLSSHITNEGVLVTYNTSAPVRNAMREAGFIIGNTLNNKRQIIGTIASKDKKQIKHTLSESQEGLLKTKAGIPYRDANLSLDNGTILLNRKKEFDSSNLISASKYLKQYKNKGNFYEK